ncbi:MAG: hypothetical protein IT210_09720 [Armatimonadetes bacterium]|nr:hypothetical protein [Armatimonadota bacterium]
MGTNVVFFGWNRPLPGMERTSAEHFPKFVEYVEGLKQQGAIQSYDVVLLDSHGGDMNGFFLIRGESARLDALLSSDEWESHIMQANLHLQGMGVVRGVTGEMVAERMNRWGQVISG